ncbi:MAG: TRAM domain-containing protein, partial [Acutalibacteraceae bacterium]|nr:TRAM domain-containing protein [Acutalibacteraceae bacterium]
AIGFAKAHVFAYSRRKGTVAYGLPEQVTKAEKSRRSRIMCEAAAECEAEFLKTMVGSTQRVLFETYENSKAFGYTENYSRVFVSSLEDLNGKIKEVNITSSESDCLEGKIV